MTTPSGSARCEYPVMRVGKHVDGCPLFAPAEPAGERTPSDEPSAEDLFWSDAANILCRAFDDFDAAMEEFREWYKPSDWLHGYRGLGAFIGIRRKAELAKALAALPSAPREREVTPDTKRLDWLEREAREQGLVALGWEREDSDWDEYSGKTIKWPETFYVNDEAQDGQPFIALRGAIDAAMSRAALSPSPDGVQK